MGAITVEVDLQKSLTNHIWFGIGWNGFWKPIKYVTCPSYYSLSHDLESNEPIQITNQFDSLLRKDKYEPCEEGETHEETSPLLIKKNHLS